MAQGSRTSPRSHWIDPDTALSRLDEFESEALERGVGRSTLRGLTEVLNLIGSQRDDPRRPLISTHPERFTAPLWQST